MPARTTASSGGPTRSARSASSSRAISPTSRCAGHALWPRERTLEWKIAAVNLVGCIAFGISAVASFWVPDSGGVLALAASNWFTALGGLCFLVGAILLLPESAATDAVESSGAALYAHP